MIRSEKLNFQPCSFLLRRALNPSGFIFLVMSEQEIRKLKGLYFFRQLKKRDPGYLRRLAERFKDLKTNAERYAKMTDQELFYAYLELMEVALEMHHSDSSENGP